MTAKDGEDTKVGVSTGAGADDAVGHTTALQALQALLAENEDDFLAATTRQLPALADSIERTRRDLAKWAADVVVARHPEVVPMRGVKGVRIIESDMDVVLRRLCVCLRHNDADGLRQHGQWYLAVVRTRPQGEAALRAAVAVLTEGLLRFHGREAGAAAGHVLLAAYDVPITPTLRPWLDHVH